MMKISQSKRQLKCCFNEYIKLMIYQASLYSIKILSSSSFFESFFVNDWAFLFDCSSFIIFRSMIKTNELIRMLSDIFISSVYTCKMIDLSDYLWLSLLTITSLSSVIFLTLFFMNKNFHSCMSFDSDIIEYESTCERLQIAWVEDIFNHMNKTLIFACETLIKTWEQMMN